MLPVGEKETFLLLCMADYVSHQCTHIPKWPPGTKRKIMCPPKELGKKALDMMQRRCEVNIQTSAIAMLDNDVHNTFKTHFFLEIIICHRGVE